MKNLVLAFFFLSINIFSQSFNWQDDNYATGLIISDEGIFLVLEDGYFHFNKSENDEAYTEYYRTIYNDSTLVNPNTELKVEYNLNFIPYLFPNLHKRKNFSFNQPMDIGMLLHLSGTDKYKLTNYGKSIIDSLLQK